MWTYKKYWNHFKKIINTEPILHLQPCTSTWTRRACGPKKGFNKEVEINCISLFHFIKTHLIFDYKVKIDYDLNPRLPITRLIIDYFDVLLCN